MIVLTVLDDKIEDHKKVLKAYWNNGNGIGIDLTQCSKETKLEIEEFLKTLRR